MASAINFKILIMIKIIMLQNYAYILNYQKSGFTNSAIVSRSVQFCFFAFLIYLYKVKSNMYYINIAI